MKNAISLSHRATAGDYETEIEFRKIRHPTQENIEWGRESRRRPGRDPIGAGSNKGAGSLEVRHSRKKT